MKMPFGKFKGVLVADLDDNYLKWLHDSIELREPLRSAIREELRRREETTGRPGEPDLKLARTVIDTGYKALALRHHPDRGGDLRVMQTLNTTVDWLRRHVEVLA
jgi:hypothetical protein